MGGLVVVDPLFDFLGAGSGRPPAVEGGRKTVSVTDGGTRGADPTGSSALGPNGEEVPPPQCYCRCLNLT